VGSRRQVGDPLAAFVAWIRGKRAQVVAFQTRGILGLDLLIRDTAYSHMPFHAKGGRDRRRHRPHRHRFYYAPSRTRSPRRLRERARGKPYFLIVVRLSPTATLGLAGPPTAAHQSSTTVLVALARVPPPSAYGFRPTKRDQRTDGSSGKNCKRPTPGDGVASQTARQLI
jgi:hypothetical protein